MPTLQKHVGESADLLAAGWSLIRAMNRQEDAEILLADLMSGLAALPGCAGAGVWLLDDEAHGLKLLGGCCHEDLGPHALEVLPARCPAVAELLQGGEVSGDDASWWRGSPGSPAGLGWTDLFLVPLEVEGRFEGALGVGCRSGRLDEQGRLVARLAAESLGSRMTFLRTAGHLRRSRSQVNTLFAILDDHLFICSPTQEILFYSGLPDADGVPSEAGEFLGTRITRVVPRAGELIRDLERQEGNSARPRLQRGELRLSDRAVPVEVRVMAGRWDERDVYYVTCRDVSARRTAELELERLGKAVEQVAESIVITDAAGDILYTNPAFTRLTGYTRQEILGVNPRVLKSGRHDPEFYAHMWRTLLRGETWSGRLDNRRKDDTIFTEEATISPIRDENGTVTHFVAVKRDVTPELALEEKLRESQKMEAIGTLAGGIAHDFNNILYALLGYVQLALDDLEAAHPVRTHLQEVSRAGERAAGLVAKMLTFGRRAGAERRPLKLQDAVREALDLARASLPATIAFDIELCPDCPEILADAAQIRQTVINLCTNAQFAMREGGTLSVGLRCDEIAPETARPWPGLPAGRWARLQFGDTGIGIEPGVRPRIFDPFFTTRPPNEGSGLGLAMVHGMVMDHGGRIFVDSEPGRGSLFTLFFPLIGQPSAPPTLRSAPSLQGGEGGASVLVLDDEPMIVDVVSKGLKRFGYRVRGFSDARRALDEFRDDPAGFDVVISDQTMPGMTGLEFAAELLSLNPDLPIILTTGYSDVLSDARIREVGVQRLLSKPLKLSMLESVLRELVPARNPS